MSAVVVIPAWRRPEFLALCLRRILAADGCEENLYLIHTDADSDYQNWVVFDREVPAGSKQFFIAFRTNRGSDGNTENVLAALNCGLQMAEEFGASTIHLLEEDVWIARDYFSCAARLHEQFRPWALSLCRNQHQKIQPREDPKLVYKSRDYQSIGVSFPLDSVREILVHNTDDYFRDMTGYLRAMFPNSKYGGLFPEQDGLIARIIEKNQYDVLYANAPRAMHAGYYSYHRTGKEPTGTLQEKIAQLETMTEQEMNDRATYKDIKMIDFDGYTVDEFQFDSEIESCYNQ